MASRTVTDADVLRRRLLLCTFGLGTNMGIKRVADGTAAVPGMEADTEAALRRSRRLFINRDNLRVVVGELHDRVAPALRGRRDHGVLAAAATAEEHRVRTPVPAWPDRGRGLA